MQNHRWRWYKVKCVNALSGLYLISTLLEKNGRGILLYRVNALSGLYLISTIGWENEERHNLMCQCPLGLIPHFYRKENFMKRFYEFCVNALSGLYLISTANSRSSQSRIHLVSMPSRAYTSFLLEKKMNTVLDSWNVSMPSRAYTSFLQYRNMYNLCVERKVSRPSRAYTSFLRSPFKNLDFMRFSEPVFAGIYQNILITAVFRAC